MTAIFAFDDKVALVTGAGSGIGRTTALKLAKAGASVMCTDIDESAAAATAAAAGTRCGSTRVDVTLAADVEAMMDRTIARYGKLDFAFNNAGILGPMGETVVEVSEEEWARTIDVNLTSVWRCMKHEIPAMLADGGGAIVNTASVAGLIGAPRNPAYGAAKHGVVGLTRSAALQYAARGVRINAVCPGVIETGFSNAAERHGDMPAFPAPYLPIGRAGRPEEIADVVMWLFSDLASYMVGEAVGADGGWRSM